MNLSFWRSASRSICNTVQHFEKRNISVVEQFASSVLPIESIELICCLRTYRWILFAFFSYLILRSIILKISRKAEKKKSRRRIFSFYLSLKKAFWTKSLSWFFSVARILRQRLNGETRKIIQRSIGRRYWIVHLIEWILWNNRCHGAR